ncbi:hypothetical protein Clacol_002267 [Clathrus columnatus]|uniref:Uncharacterized protein n=1 Tax=Clathrus columnatus TaxID=1419009 RepID=A0AAV5A4X6_9AGAM|nr:hypothetical protein Clacol_002267 [Clathrus columnatus]
MRINTLFLDSSQRLEKRKGGGGHGSSGKSSGSKSSGSSSGSKGSSSKGSSSGSSSSRPLGPSVPIKSSGRTSNVQSYANGVPVASPIPAGQIFAGRLIGGGTRTNIFGTRRYGSGYPGIASTGVTGRGFPFGFWPVTFGAGAVNLHNQEYGNPNNSSRPGGPLFVAPFQPINGSETYRVLSDNATVQSLITIIAANCSLTTTTITAVPFNDSSQASNQPKPEQVIEYYRSSSIALTLDGYNNSAVFSSNDSMPDTPLPSNLNTTFLDCINQTIGAGAPLFDGAQSVYGQPYSVKYKEKIH